MNTKALLLVLGTAIVGVLGCYPGSVTVSELDSLLTLYDDQQDFSLYNTFHMPDTIIALGDEEDEVSHKYDRQILDQIRDNFLALGYTEEDSINDAHLVVLVEKSRSDIYVYNWCGYWCWYGGWPWYGGGYYPYYPSGGYTYSYPVGTIFITALDATAEMGMNVPAPWTAAFNGLISGSDSSILSRIDRAIDQAFAQSPYLGK